MSCNASLNKTYMIIYLNIYYLYKKLGFYLSVSLIASAIHCCQLKVFFLLFIKIHRIFELFFEWYLEVYPKILICAVVMFCNWYRIYLHLLAEKSRNTQKYGKHFIENNNSFEIIQETQRTLARLFRWSSTWRMFCAEILERIFTYFHIFNYLS